MSMPTGPGSTRCANTPGKAWPARLKDREKNYGLDQKDPACRPHHRHLHRRSAQHGVGKRVPWPARAGDQVSGGRDRSEVRPARPAQQADHGDRPADRHHGLDRWTLLGDHQEPADRPGGLLELGWFHRRRDEKRRLGHDHLRGQVTRAGLSVCRKRQGRAALRGRPLGQVGVGDRRDAAQDTSGSAVAYRLYRPVGRGRLSLCSGGQRSAPRGRAFRRRHRDGLEESEGGGGSRHPGCRQHRRPEGIHGRGECRQAGAGGQCGHRPGACRPTAPRF